MSINNDNNIFIDKSLKNITNSTTNKQTRYFIFQNDNSFRYLTNNYAIPDHSIVHNTNIKNMKRCSNQIRLIIMSTKVVASIYLKTNSAVLLTKKRGGPCEKYSVADIVG